MSQEKILYNDDRAARHVTVTGWTDAMGRFWGSDENAARYSSCTHMLCACGKEMNKGWTKCDACRRQALIIRYNGMPFEEWDGIEPICVIDASENEYFFSEEELLDYCETEDIKPQDLMLVICKPNYPRLVSGDYWSDSFPEDQTEDDVFSSEVLKKISELNKLLKEHKPISYSPGTVRTGYSSK
jgi:hypothetical protein